MDFLSAFNEGFFCWGSYNDYNTLSIFKKILGVAETLLKTLERDRNKQCCQSKELIMEVA